MRALIAKAAPALCMRMHSLKIGLKNITGRSTERRGHRGIHDTSHCWIQTGGITRLQAATRSPNASRKL
jgi:hypothetical protein